MADGITFLAAEQWQQWSSGSWNRGEFLKCRLTGVSARRVRATDGGGTNISKWSGHNLLKFTTFFWLQKYVQITPPKIFSLVMAFEKRRRSSEYIEKS